MKLLIDENLSAKLVKHLAHEFPGSMHVVYAGLAGAEDVTVWEYAKSHGLVILSKDDDFRLRALLLGPPPKVIGVLGGYASTSAVVTRLRQCLAEFAVFEADERAPYFAVLI